MSIRRDIPLEEFEIIISPPSNRLASMCVNIYEDGKFNLNGKLAAKIGGKKLGIRLTRDGKYLCLIENGDNEIKRNPPVKRGGSSYAGKALCSSHNVSTRKYDLPAAKGLLLATRKRVGFRNH